MKIIILFIIFIFPFSLLAIARPLGMGGAYVAFASDSNAIFYNPAGMAMVKEKEGSYMKVLNNKDSINFRELSAFCNEGIGGGYLHTLNVDWENYVDLNYDGKRDNNEPYLANKDNVAILTLGGYGEGSLRKTAFGINIKRYSESLMESYGEGEGFSEIAKKQGLGIDVGVLHHISKDVSIGFAMYDINEPKFVYENINISNRVYDLKIRHPLILTSGVCLKPDDKTIIGIDLYAVNNINDWYSKNEDDRDQSSVRFGFERWVLPNFAIRGGYGGGFHSAGFGIKIKNTRFDYALMEKGNMGFHIVSLTIK